MGVKHSLALSEKFLNSLHYFLPSECILNDSADCLMYSYDNSRYQSLPDIVLLPRHHDDVVDIVNLCYQHNIALTARGRGTNTTGAAIPMQGGVVLSLERMQNIKKLEPYNRSITVETGILNQTVQQACLQHGFFWPPDPTSSAFSTIGGNLACNAGGPRAVKYGACRENVLALKAVTGQGQTLHTGFYTTKYAVGYDLTRLLIGSEGTLAIITEATLKLAPLPQKIFTFACYFDSELHAIKAIYALMNYHETPYILEFMDQEALNKLRPLQSLSIKPNAQALLFFELQGMNGQTSAQLFSEIKPKITQGLVDYQIAETEDEKKMIWQTRKALSPALKQVAPTKINEDIVVPLTQLAKFIEFINNLRQTYTMIIIIVFGHVGNGNLHVNLLFNKENPEQAVQAEKCLNALFEKVLALDGTLSGEHGIGYDKKAYLPKTLDPCSLTLMKGIKALFDPKGILNPGKLF